MELVWLASGPDSKIEAVSCPPDRRNVGPVSNCSGRGVDDRLSITVDDTGAGPERLQAHIELVEMRLM